jgi:hypothetical protein
MAMGRLGRSSEGGGDCVKGRGSGLRRGINNQAKGAIKIGLGTEVSVFPVPIAGKDFLMQMIDICRYAGIGFPVTGIFLSKVVIVKRWVCDFHGSKVKRRIFLPSRPMTQEQIKSMRDRLVVLRRFL